MMTDLLPDRAAAVDVWQRLREESRPLVVYGMGNGADKLLVAFSERGLCASDFVASDGFVRGQTFHGRRVLSFRELDEKYREYVLVLAFGSSRPEVLEQLASLSHRVPLCLPDLPVAGEDIFDAAYYRAHYEDFLATWQEFADETSRRLYAEILRYKLTGDIGVLMDACNPAEDAWRLLSPGEIRTYVDAGAYTGDTLRELIEQGAPLTHALCIEPDRRNFRKLRAFADTLACTEVTCVQAAVWREDSRGTFHDSGNRNASLVGGSYEAKDTEVPLVALDSLITDLLPDYVKFDVEGAEESALLGASSVIRQARPKVRLSLYHRTCDLYVLPRLLRRLCPGYDFYLRRKRCLPAWELDLIAIPGEKGGTPYA